MCAHPAGLPRQQQQNPGGAVLPKSPSCGSLLLRCYAIKQAICHLVVVMLPQDSLTQPLRFGLGVGVSSSNSDDPFLTATASKKISLFEGDHTQLTAKARVELDPRSSKVCVLHGYRMGALGC
jgi:hypothetical protein